MTTKLFFGLLIILVAAIFFAWKNFPNKLPLPIPGKCGIENCHGLEITCGPNVPDVCTANYEIGDNCRKYANCQTINGKCQMQPSEKFNQCVSCVKKCQQEFLNDTVNAMTCESTCSE